MMCFLQYHLKRMLAFATVSSVGLALVGIGLFTSDDFAGTAVYVFGDGLVKASLYVSVGILQHRRVRLGETRLRSLGRGLPYTAVVFVLGRPAFAGMPPFSSFLGKTMIEEAVHKEGYTWVSALLTLSSLIVGGAVLRAAGRVFLSWGPEPETDPESWRAEPEKPEIEEARGYTPANLAGRFWTVVRPAQRPSRRLCSLDHTRSRRLRRPLRPCSALIRNRCPRPGDASLRAGLLAPPESGKTSTLCPSAASGECRALYDMEGARVTDERSEEQGETVPLNWACTRCGYHVEGELPEKCPDCGADREAFEEVPVPGF